MKPRHGYSQSLSEIACIILNKRNVIFCLWYSSQEGRDLQSTHSFLAGPAEYIIKQKTVSGAQNWNILDHAVSGQACVCSLFIYGIFNRWNINI